MGEQMDQSLDSPPRPSGDDRQAWQAYWRQMGQPWRTEPEIDTKRQAQLAASRSTAPDIEQGIYPFKGMQLSRADVEWLLAMHEGGRGPVNWNEERQREREGLDVRGADLRGTDLSSLPLARLRGGLKRQEWRDATEEQRALAVVRLQDTNLREVRLQEANLREAQVQRADLREARLQGAILNRAQLQEAVLRGAQLQGVDLFQTHLEQADLRGARLDGADIEEAVFSAEKQHIGPWLSDVQWGMTNLTVVKWSEVAVLSEEINARQKMHNGTVKDEATRLREYEEAVRANRQLAVALQVQGLNEDAARFAYRAQCLQRGVLWLQMIGQSIKLRRRWQALGAWLFSWFLNGVAGYGYRPQRCFYVYVLALVGFTLAHYIVGTVAEPHLTWLSALAVSVQSLHGRIFSFQPGDPQTLLNTIEAFVGLFIEAIVVAVITQRILGK